MGSCLLKLHLLQAGAPMRTDQIRHCWQKQARSPPKKCILFLSFCFILLFYLFLFSFNLFGLVSCAAVCATLDFWTVKQIKKLGQCSIFICFLLLLSC